MHQADPLLVLVQRRPVGQAGGRRGHGARDARRDQYCGRALGAAEQVEQHREVQQPSGSRTSAGCAGWPNGTPCSASVRGPAGARNHGIGQAVDDGIQGVGRSMRSASAAGRDSRAPLRCLPRAGSCG